MGSGKVHEPGLELRMIEMQLWQCTANRTIGANLNYNFKSILKYFCAVPVIMGMETFMI